MRDSYLQTVDVRPHSSPLTLFGLAEIGIAPPGKKDWKVTLAEGKRRQKTAVERFSSACAVVRQVKDCSCVLDVTTVFWLLYLHVRSPLDN
jgi:hypothetical protein